MTHPFKPLCKDDIAEVQESLGPHHRELGGGGQTPAAGSFWGTASIGIRLCSLNGWTGI